MGTFLFEWTVLVLAAEVGVTLFCRTVWMATDDG